MYKPVNVGAPRPMNTLLGNSPVPRPHFGASTSSQTLSNSPTAYQPRLFEFSPSHAHSQAKIVTSSTYGGPLTPRKRSIGDESQAGSQFSISSSMSTSSMVGETSSAKARRKRKRPRKNTKSSRIPGNEGDVQSRVKISCPPSKSDENEDYYEGDGETEDDDVQLLGHREASTRSRLPRSEGPERSIGEIENRFRKKRTYPEPVEQFKKVVDNVERGRLYCKAESPDELALDMEEIRARPVKRTKRSPSGSSKRTAILPREAKRVTIAKALPAVDSSQQGIDERMREAQLIIGNGLRIVRGASGNCRYRADCKDDPDLCLLSVREISHTLIPVDQDNNMLIPYQYLTLNIEKAKLIVHPESYDDCLIVSIRLDRPNITFGAGPKLMVEFATSKMLSRFMEWVNVFTKGNTIEVRECRRAKLEQQFEEMESRAINNKILRDDDLKEGRGAEDIKVMQHNHNKRMSEAERKPYFVSEARPPTKIKDAMMPSISSSGDRTISRPIRGGQASAQPQLPTTRSMFALADIYESSETEPEGWTSLNPGWGKDWRNSLVFPSKGKNRAIVDKEDIQRLDEGQFLNDNIIIFYLRYLQKKVEDEQPDLARRVYFHNTFFYDKLKPTKSSKGINYDSVKAWTSKVDLFSKDFIIVPINEYTHWYVAIICNAPKLVPSTDRRREADDIESQASTTPTNATISQVSRQTSPEDKAVVNGSSTANVATIAQEDVTEHLRCMSIDPIGRIDHKTKKNIDNDNSAEVGSTLAKHDHEVHLIKDSDRPEIEIERMTTAVSPQSRKKTSKGQSTAARKYDPNQPRIITLDSLGATHSPTCGYLKQYLVAELWDKKGVEATTTTIMGTTAREIPEQTNHCDCGLFLLGYIQEFLNNPDVFVQSLLQRDGKISWRLDPSELRASIRDCIFQLQRKQQEDENLAQERKRQAKIQIMHTTPNLSSQAAAPSSSPPHHTLRQDLASQKPRNDIGNESGKSTLLPTLRPPFAIGNSRAGGDVIIPKHTKTLSEDAKHAVIEERLFGSTVRHIDLPQVVRHRKRASVDQAFFSPNTDLQAAVSSHQIREPSRTQAPHPMPGTFPKSPSEADVRSHSVSPETKSSIGFQKPFVSPLLSDTPSSKGSRDGTPLFPVIVEDSDSKRHRPVPDSGKYAQPLSDIVVEIHSKSSHSRAANQTGNTNGQKQGGEKSPYFPNRRDGERVTSAKLREKSKDNVIDLSDD